MKLGSILLNPDVILSQAIECKKLKPLRVHAWWFKHGIITLGVSSGTLSKPIIFSWHNTKQWNITSMLNGNEITKCWKLLRGALHALYFSFPVSLMTQICWNRKEKTHLILSEMYKEKNSFKIWVTVLGKSLELLLIFC